MKYKRKIYIDNDSGALDISAALSLLAEAGSNSKRVVLAFQSMIAELAHRPIKLKMKRLNKI